MGESGKDEEAVMLMPLVKILAYEHCFYAKKGIRCIPPSTSETLEDLFFMR